MVIMSFVFLYLKEQLLYVKHTHDKALEGGASSEATKRASAAVEFGNVYGNGNQEWNSDNVDTSMGPENGFTNPLHSPSAIKSMQAELSLRRIRR